MRSFPQYAGYVKGMGNQSSARLEGDRYQHLYSWYLILDLLDSAKGIDHIWLEHPHAGAADDVTVHPARPDEQPTRYYQIKWHVDYRSGYSMTSLVETEGNTSSLLYKLWKSWQLLREQGKENIQIWLVSDWATVPNDSLGILIRARDGGIDEEFLTANHPSKLGRSRQLWQEHLAASDADLTTFCRALHFKLGFASMADLNEIVDTKMQLHGLEVGEKARGASMDQVRNWIEEGGTRKRITRDALSEALDRLDLWAVAEEQSGIVIALHTWAKRKYDRQSDYELDWSEHFDHVARRVPSVETWNQVLLPTLRNLERVISQNESHRLIRLRGSLCLSAAFAFGQVFSEAGSYRIELQHRGSMWQSETSPDTNCRLEVVEEQGADAATDILVVLSITGDAKPQVLEFIKNQGLSFRRYVFLSPINGAHDSVVQNAAHACAIAQQIRVEIRRILNAYQPRMNHLFYFGPRSLAVLIGHRLNACGTIQLYEYQNPGYAPSCVLK
jgi:hypothetical protein